MVHWTGVCGLGLKVETSYFQEGLLMLVLHVTAAFPLPGKSSDPE